jgi:hypothetical protein
MKPLHVALLTVAGLGAAYLVLAPAAGAKILPPAPPPGPPLPSPPSPSSKINAMVTVPFGAFQGDTQFGLAKAVGASIPTLGPTKYLNVLVTGELGELLTGRVVGVFMEDASQATVARPFWYVPVSTDYSVSFSLRAVVDSPASMLYQATQSAAPAPTQSAAPAPTQSAAPKGVVVPFSQI